MKYNSLILAVACLSVGGTMSGQVVSVREAQSRAYDFVQQQVAKHGNVRGAKPVSELSLVYTRERAVDRHPIYYVFSLGEDRGYVIMGGDERARDVLTYSPHGSFEQQRMAPAFAWWLEQYERQISDAIDQDENAGNSARSGASTRAAETPSRHSVEPLLTTTWGQNVPYNNLVNAEASNAMGANFGLVTGCVATAMSQVMNYHQWPETGTGEHQGKNYLKSAGEEFHPYANFAETTYDWEHMRDSYVEGNYSEQEADAVATLMYHAGVAMDMKYGSSSEASSYNITSALTTYFGYDRSAAIRLRDCYTDAEWEEMMYNELAAGRPVIYSGHQPQVGHTFVCCGYDADTDLYYFNWGWNGTSDNFCPLSGTKALTPVGTGTGGGAANTAYTQNQNMIVRVMPDERGEERPNLFQIDDPKWTVCYALMDGTEQIDHYDYNSIGNKTLTLKSTMLNMSTSLTSFQKGVKAKDKNTGVQKIWFVGGLNINRSSITNPNLDFTLQHLTYKGIYEISPVVTTSLRPKDEDWVDVPVSINHKLPTVTKSFGLAPDPCDIAFSIEDNEVEVSRIIRVMHSDGYEGELTYSSSDPAVATVDADGNVTGVKRGTTTITVEGSEMQLGGSTYFKATSASFVVTVNDLVKDQATVTLPQSYLALQQSVQIEVSDGYDGVPQFSSSNPEVAMVDASGLVTGVAEGKSTLTVTLPETAYWIGTTAEFEVSVTSTSCYLVAQPYFDNDNNPYDGNFKLHVGMHNAGGDKTTVFVVAEVHHLYSNGNDVALGYSRTQVSISSGSTYWFNMDMSYWNCSAGERYRIHFYQDEACAKPWNVEPLEFVCREPLVVNYTLTTAGVGTLILPFDAELPSKDIDDNPIKWKAYGCKTLSENGQLNLVVATQLKRNTPYLLMGDPATCRFEGPNAVEAPSYTDGLLTGVLLDQTVPFGAGDYILQSHNGRVAFYRYDPETAEPNGGYCPANRAYLHTGAMSSEHAVFEIVEPEPDGIVELRSEVKYPAGIFGLDGTRRDRLEPGINIVVDAKGTRRIRYN